MKEENTTNNKQSTKSTTSYMLRRAIFMCLVFFIRLKRAVTYDLSSAWWKLGVAVVVGAISTFLFSISSGLLWFIFLMYLLYDWDNRYLGAIAILCLISCPLLLALNRETSQAMAESMAVYAFFFLVMTVTLQLVDLKRHPTDDQDSTNSHEETTE